MLSQKGTFELSPRLRRFGTCANPVILRTCASASAFLASIFTKHHSLTKLDVMIPTKTTEQLFLQAWTETHEDLQEASRGY
jgi:hypothetical protein